MDLRYEYLFNISTKTSKSKTVEYCPVIPKVDSYALTYLFKSISFHLISAKCNPSLGNILWIMYIVKFNKIHTHNIQIPPLFSAHLLNILTFLRPKKLLPSWSPLMYICISSCDIKPKLVLFTTHEKIWHVFAQFRIDIYPQTLYIFHYTYSYSNLIP